jgi:cation transport ATPase
MNSTTQTNTYRLTGLHCGSCVRKVTEALQPFAQDVKVTLDPMQAALTGETSSGTAHLAALQQAIGAVGKYAIEAKPPAPHALGAPSASLPKAPEAAGSAPASSWLSTYFPLLLILAFILGASLLVQVGLHSVSASETMRYFMAGFFLVFAFFKLLDIRAFANAYAGYDLLAARWRGWGLVYPFVELALGMAYLANYNPVLTQWVTVIVMGFSAVGVIKAVLSKTQIQCACLGTVFKLPMSTVTIVEDVGMVLMAGWMLSGN